MELAISKGASRSALLARSRIERALLEDVDARIPFSSYVALMKSAQELCNDPALALHFGEAVGPDEISLGNSVGGVSNLQEALTQGNRYAPLAVEVEVDGPGERFQVRMIDGAPWFVDARRNPNDFPELTESAFARMTCTSRAHLGGRTAYTCVHFTHADPGYRAEYERIFAVPVVFGSDRNALKLDETVMATFQYPTPPRNVTRVVRDHADALLQKLERAESTRDRVEKLLAPLLGSGDVQITMVAAALCCSRQSLFRKLKVEGVTFEQLLDELRHKEAIRHLGERGASVKEAARLVGYSDPASFSRAFKRWTGSSPRGYAAKLARTSMEVPSSSSTPAG
ncbi:MAG: AraC family transcriptional regulator [Gemmatimonadetes bacterium]|nr:AraC family transcriptional regulator [Gemmatimonadota bacterium]